MAMTEEEHSALVDKALDSIPGYPFLPCPICLGTEGCDHTVVERATAYAAHQAAKNDARLYGSGFVRTYPDGRVEHVPVSQLVMHVRPNTQED